MSAPVRIWAAVSGPEMGTFMSYDEGPDPHVVPYLPIEEHKRLMAEARERALAQAQAVSDHWASNSAVARSISREISALKESKP